MPNDVARTPTTGVDHSHTKRADAGVVVDFAVVVIITDGCFAVAARLTITVLCRTRSTGTSSVAAANRDVRNWRSRR